MAVPERKAHTVTVAVAAAAFYPLPTDADGLTALRVIGANGVWLCHLNGNAAVAEGADCEFIPSGGVVYVTWGKNRSINMIAVTADSKVNMVNAQDRM